MRIRLAGIALVVLAPLAACDEPVSPTQVAPPDSQSRPRVIIEPSAAFLEGTGAVTQFTARVDSGGALFDAPGATWTVSNADIATIGGDGLLMPLRAGQVAVTARVGDREGYALATVREPAPGAWQDWDLTTAQTNATLAVGGAGDDLFLVSSLGEILPSDGATVRSADVVFSGVELTAVEVFGAEAIAVGTVAGEWAGRAFHYDGLDWQPMQLPPVPSLMDVWGSAPDDVWAVSNHSQILHYDGTAWRIVIDHPADSIHVGHAAVWGTGPDEAFALLPSDRVLHFEGGDPTAWTSLGLDSEGIFTSLWGTGPDDLFVVGSQTFSDVDSTRAFHYDGADWSPVTDIDGLQGRFSVVGGSAPDNLYVGGGAGIHSSVPYLFHFDGEQWRQLDDVPEHGLGLVDSWTPPSGDVFLSGHRGALVRAEEGQLTILHHANIPHLHDIWGASETDLFAVGAGGTILHGSGDVWEPMGSGTDRDLLTVWGVGPGTVFAAGEAGTVLRLDGAWRPLPPAGSGDVLAVWGLAEDDLFAAVRGSDGRADILHYDGSAWSPSPLDPPEDKATSFETDIRAFWGFGPDEIFGAGKIWWRECDGCSLQLRDAILQWDGTAWQVAQTGTSHDNHLADIWASSPHDIWAVGSHGSNPYVVHYDGTSWREVDIAVPPFTYPPLTAVWGTGPRDVYAGGLDGLLLHYDGADWEALQTPVQETVNGIWGTPTGPAWAVTGARFNPAGGGILRASRN